MICALADRQHEIVHRRQLLAAGLTDQMIRGRIERRLLRPLHRGVYKVGPGRPSEEGLFMAAVFAAGEGSALSHRSAAALWRLRPQNAGPIEVTTPRRGTRVRPGLRIHAARTLPAREVTYHRGIPCTTPSRTLVDLAADLWPRELRRALEQAQIERIFDLDAIEAALASANGRKGSGRLRALMAELHDEPAPTRSELEMRFLDLVRSASLPSPVVNAAVCGHEVDFHWPTAKLIVETDGSRTHSTPIAFERDRRRDLRLESAGWHVIRLTWGQITREPETVTALLRGRL